MAKFRIQNKQVFDNAEQAEIHMNLNYSAKGSHEVVEELEVIEVDPIREIIMYYLIWAIFLLAVFTFSIAIGVVIATIKYA